ncbi:iron ABC transporter ATP-binding protein [Roseibium aquae]|uniref:Iron ABC transporter ATP-binding protein n=1 Tax=Roseibium aquae TaxID=1323746 RepID=A0A916X2F1_9HYPH|nr:ABC transporter ATP-binding protein [Roseibium aquae]GGB54268.1 iron ABC transporter ATP-binding protein [Roseibium aquae]
MPRHIDGNDTRDPGAAEGPRWGERGTAGATIAAGLTYEAVTHHYGDVPSVRDLSLEIAPGEVLCLLGHSGCGKTTLMRVAAGIERQTSGRVLINGREVAGPNVFLPPERRGVGLMFQDYALFPHMTIGENVMFGLTNMPKQDREKIARAALSRVGLADYASDYPHALSGGEQQRVALARAMAPRPGILLMDEPFSGLDRRLRDRVREETLTILRETRATCIIVTHDPEEAMRLGDKIALMRGGRLVQHGTAGELYNTPVDAFVARFFSEVNLIEGVAADATRVDTALGPVVGAGFAPGLKVDVCIRPQGILLDTPENGPVQARIMAKRFVGEVDLVTLIVDGLDEPLHARLRAGSPWRVGNDVSVSTDPKDVLVFPAGTAHLK